MDALRQAAFEVLPLAGGHDTWQQVVRKDALGSLAVAVHGEGNALGEERAVGRLLMPLQFVLFCMVGASGVAVHLGTLWLAHREFGQDFMLSQTIATLVAMTSNYALNNEFTYRDRKRRGLDWLTGLLSFYAVCGLGVIANVGVAGSLFLREGWLIAAFAGTVVGVMWNYKIGRAHV